MGGTCIVPGCTNTNNKQSKSTMQITPEKKQKITFHE